MATKTLQPKSGKREPDLFTRMIAIDTVPESGLDVCLNATAAECATLANACGLVAVQEFEAKLRVEKIDRVRFNVAGTLRAAVIQTCVVSLEPFETLVEAPIDVDFAPLGGPITQALGPKVSEGGGGPAGAVRREEEPPDPIIDGKIDLGALAAEFLVLNLDVYPRKPGVTFDAPELRSDDAEKNSPFAVLRDRS